MKIAIPVADGQLFAHFGHCPGFALLDADTDTGKVLARNDVAAPPHEPGLLPIWLAERGVEMVMTGGIGPKAVELLAQKGIAVVTGISGGTPEALVSAYFTGVLETGGNACTHESA